MPSQVPDPGQRLQRLEWTVIRRLDGIMQGDYRTLFRGPGTELAELREYAPGDDVRSIDWNVTARMDAPYVRQFLEDRENTMWFLLDMSPSIDFGLAGRTKRDLVVDFTTIIARLLTRHGNRVGAVLFSGAGHRVIPASGGRAQVLRLIEEMENVPRLARSPRTDLGSLISVSYRVLRRRSFVFLISDFLSIDGWDRALALLARRHEVIAVRVSDPAEADASRCRPACSRGCRDRRTALCRHPRSTFPRPLRRSRRTAERGDQRPPAARGGGRASLSTDGDVAREIVRVAAERKRRRAAQAFRSARHGAVARKEMA